MGQPFSFQIKIYEKNGDSKSLTIDFKPLNPDTPNSTSELYEPIVYTTETNGENIKTVTASLSPGKYGRLRQKLEPYCPEDARELSKKIEKLLGYLKWIY